MLMAYTRVNKFAARMPGLGKGPLHGAIRSKSQRIDLIQPEKLL
jgi:hypothetical protein